MERFGEFGGGGDDGSWDFCGIGRKRSAIGFVKDSAHAKGLLQIWRFKSIESTVTSWMEERAGLETWCAILRQWSLLALILAPTACMKIGIRSRMGPKSQVYLAGAKNRSGSELLHRIIQCQLDSTMILYSAKFGPRCSLARKLGIYHELDRWIREHARKVCVRYLRKNGNVARVLLTQDGNSFGQGVGKKA